ncbi:MAG TPA: SPOR domain-containing protein [Steroidobacteraceae bacterium]|nr:SPOR domain-containing protein [Steroidobacteraceae bacterium]
MDEQVKARLIGATVLVVIAVILVPAVLSGPKRDVAAPATGDGKRGTRTYTIDLGGAVANGARLQPVPQPAPPARETPRLPTVEAPGAAATRGEPDAEAGDGSARQGAPAIAPAATVVASEPVAPPPAPVPVANAPKGSWSVQVGAFGSADSARKLVADLKKDGLPAYLAPLSRNGKTLHRVRVGPEPTRAAADTVAARLRSRGLPAAVVAAD